MQPDKDYITLIAQCELELSKQTNNPRLRKIKAYIYGITRAAHLKAGLDGPTRVTAQSEGF